jgi:hypothetical protein
MRMFAVGLVFGGMERGIFIVSAGVCFQHLVFVLFLPSLSIISSTFSYHFFLPGSEAANSSGRVLGCESIEII